jgi:hypothetical protein
VKRLLLLILSLSVASVSASQFKSAQVNEQNTLPSFATTQQDDTINHAKKSWVPDTRVSLDSIHIVELRLESPEQTKTAFMTMTEVVYRITQGHTEQPSTKQYVALQTAQPVKNNSLSPLNDSDYSAKSFVQNYQVQQSNQPLNYTLPAVPSLLESSMNAKPQVMF